MSKLLKKHTNRTGILRRLTINALHYLVDSIAGEKAKKKSFTLLRLPTRDKGERERNTTNRPAGPNKGNIIRNKAEGGLVGKARSLQKQGAEILKAAKTRKGVLDKLQYHLNSLYKLVEIVIR